MMKDPKEHILHKQKSFQYSTKDDEKFKQLIKLYEAADDKIGRDAITAVELSNLAEQSYESFRKILNAQRSTPRRDYIILIGILLRMDSNEINNLLSWYGMPGWNPQYDDRDSKLMDIADSLVGDSNPNLRLSAKEINQRLTDEGFPELELTERKKPQKRKGNYIILIHQNTTVTNDELLGRGSPIGMRYDSQNYRFYSKMIIQEKKTGQLYVLTADNRGNLFLEKSPWPGGGENPFLHYNNIGETGEFKEYFRDLIRNVQHEKRKIYEILDDTKNYGERIGAGMHDDKFRIFVETYNYEYPERGEYYLMQLEDGKYTLFVSQDSLFMKWYLREDEYRARYRNQSTNILEKFRTESEIEEIISEQYDFDLKELYKSRKKKFRKMQETLLMCLEQIREGKVRVRSIEDEYDDEPDRVCIFFGVEKEFRCEPNEDMMGMIVANRREYGFSGDYGTVDITMEDLYQAFNLGFNCIDEICRIKARLGAINAVLDLGQICPK